MARLTWPCAARRARLRALRTEWTVPRGKFAAD
jgi:hypothetical protein